MEIDSPENSPTTTNENDRLAQTSESPGWFSSHLWPLLGMLAILLTGMAFSFWWNPIVHGVSEWSTPPDLWGTFRDAHYIIWSGEGHVYNASTSFVTFPGIAVLLAPFAAIQQHFHLTESIPVYLMKPTAWYVLGPVDMICGGVLLFPLDALARRLSVTSKRRILLTFLEVVLIWPTVVWWGHPEDTLALAFALTGLMAALDRRWVHSACFFALAVVFQPLVVLMVPVVLAYVPVKRWPAFAGIVAVPTVLLLTPPLIQEWGPTTYAIFKQPNYPTLNHPTPWLDVAPVVKKGGFVLVGEIHLVVSHGRRILEYGPVKVYEGATVAAGPGRVFALVLACAIGIWVAKKKPPVLQVLWWVAVALALRCIFECVMDPYYLLPALALALVVAFRLGWTRISLTVLAAAACTWFSYWKTTEWNYYLVVIGLLLLALAFSWPGNKQRADDWTPRSSADDASAPMPQPASPL
ncbi:MAG: hypothetical protein WBL51_03525 [Acidimicrobiales bacterium]